MLLTINQKWEKLSNNNKELPRCQICGEEISEKEFRERLKSNRITIWKDKPRHELDIAHIECLSKD